MQAEAMGTLADQRVETAIESYFDAISRRDRRAWEALFAADASVHDPVGTVPAEGREGLAEIWTVLSGPFEGLAMHADEIFYAGSGAAVRWKGTATGNKDATFEFGGITVFEVGADGRIQTLMAYWDPADLLIRLSGDTDDDDSR